MKNGIDFDFKYKCDQYEAHIKITGMDAQIWISTTQIYPDGRCIVNSPVEINDTDDLKAMVSMVNGLGVTHDVLAGLMKFISHKTVDLCGEKSVEEGVLRANTKLRDAAKDSVDISNFSTAMFPIPKEVN